MKQIDIEEIKKSLHTKWLGHNMICLEETDSTNEQVRILAQEGAQSGTLVVADKQTAGRGRRGRSWESPSGKNLYFSLLVRPELPVEKASMLTLVMAHAVAVATRGILSDNHEQVNLGIKWPNDIVINGRKVCGILTELRMEEARLLQSSELSQAQAYYVIIGVGINVRKQEFPKELCDKATDLETASGIEMDRNRLLAEILNVFERDYEQFVKVGDLSGLREEYEVLLVNKDREVCVLEPTGDWKGIAKGITSTGELLVASPDGSIKQVYAGEVSVRGIYGYV